MQGVIGISKSYPQYKTVSLRSIGIDSQRPVLDFAIKNVETIHTHDTIHKVVNKVIRTGFRRFPVISSKGFPIKRKIVVGIVTVMDILDAFLREVDFNKHISEIMNRDFIFCYSSETIGTALNKLKFAKRGGFPVIDKRKTPLGLITEHDIIALFKGHKFNIKVSDIMTHKPFFITPIMFYDALNTMINTRYRKLPVIDNHELVGLITDRLCLDVIRASGFQRNKLFFNTKDVMIKNVYTVPVDADISEAIEMMVQYRIGGLVVTSNNNLKGIITERDVLEKITK